MDTLETKKKIKQIIVKRLNLKIEPNEIEDNMLLFGSKEDGKGLGLDSIDSLELAVGIMEEFEVVITDDDMSIFQSVSTINDFIQDNKN